MKNNSDSDRQHLTQTNDKATDITDGLRTQPEFLLKLDTHTKHHIAEEDPRNNEDIMRAEQNRKDDDAKKLKTFSRTKNL